MTRRKEFSTRTKLQSWDRSGGCCEECGRKIFPGDGPEYDHIISCENGGTNELKNCQVLCTWCHKTKTRADMAVTVKGRKVRAQHARAKTPKRKFMGWRRLDGSIVWND